MKSFIGGCVVGGLFLMSYYGGNQPILRAADPPAVPDASPASTLNYTVEISAGDGTGSGVMLFVGGGVTDIITCDHVVTDAGKIKHPTLAYVFYHGAKFTGRVVREDERNDLAVVSVAAELGPPATIDLAAAQPGAKELVVGSPYGLGLEITEGYVSRYTTPPGENQLMLQGSAETWPGNSGGPVFIYDPQHHEWELVGVIDGVWYQNNQPIPTINYAIPSSTILLFLGSGLTALNRSPQ
jgi:S1-C subfamily serine protease